MTTPVDRRTLDDSDAGFGLVEIMISMMLLTIISLALLPLLVTGAKQSAVNLTTARATQAVSQDLESVRAAAASCAGLTSAISAGAVATQDSRGVPITLSRTSVTCTTTPALVTYTITARANGSTVAAATTKLLVRAP